MLLFKSWQCNFLNNFPKDFGFRNFTRFYFFRSTSHRIGSNTSLIQQTYILLKLLINLLQEQRRMNIIIKKSFNWFGGYLVVNNYCQSILCSKVSVILCNLQSLHPFLLRVSRIIFNRTIFLLPSQLLHVLSGRRIFSTCLWILLMGNT